MHFIRVFPRDKVRKELAERLGAPELISHPKKKVIPDQKEECSLADIETREKAYSVLLSKLSLAADHRENLRGRGLTEAQIERLGYRTTPVVGMSAIAKQLQSEKLKPAGVPGFYWDKNGEWTFIHEKRGILIPVRNRSGKIQGMQILQLLGDMGFTFGTYLWDPRYKGLDDYIWEYCLQRQPQ